MDARIVQSQILSKQLHRNEQYNSYSTRLIDGAKYISSYLNYFYVHSFLIKIAFCAECSKPRALSLHYPNSTAKSIHLNKRVLMYNNIDRWRFIDTRYLNFF